MVLLVVAGSTVLEWTLSMAGSIVSIDSVIGNSSHSYGDDMRSTLSHASRVLIDWLAPT